MDASNRAVTSNRATASVDVTQSPALSLTKTPNRPTVTATGQTVVYTFVVTNVGNVTVTDPSVADVFQTPAGPPITPTCPAGALSPGASVTCTAAYTVTLADLDNAAIKNAATASATSPTGGTVTSPPANSTVTAMQSPGMTIVKSATPTVVSAAGTQINYSFTVTNTGNVTLSLLTVLDTLTAPAAPVPAVTCPATTVLPGDVVVCTATYTVTQADIDNGSIDNSAVAQATDPGGNPVTSPPSTATVTTTRTSALNLVKSAAPTTVTAAGQVVTYTFTVTNTGTVTITNLAIADTFTAPAGPPLSPIACVATTLAPTATTTCSASYTATLADLNNGTIDNSAIATGTDPQGATVASNPSTATVSASAAPSLALTKAAAPTSVTAAGQPVTYTFTVKNTGNVTVSTIAISDPRLTTAPACAATTLAPDASTTCTATYTVTQADIDAGTITNTATATGHDPKGNPVTSPPATATVDVNAAAALSVTKAATPTAVTTAGQTVTYTFAVTNIGAVTVHNVNIVDRFTAPGGPPLSPITCLTRTLAPAAQTTCIASYTVTQADVDNGSIANTATAAGFDPRDAAVGSAPSSALVTVSQRPSLVLVKTANPTAASRAGQTVTYTFAVTNTGNVTIANLAIADTFTAPAGPALVITCAATILAPTATTTCTAGYVLTQADVDNGVVDNSAVATGLDPTGSTVTSPPSTAEVTIAAGPALTLVKTAAPTTYNAAGQPIAYTFTVTNTGTVTVTGLVVGDAMFTGAAAPVCAATTLVPNQSTTCTASYTTTQADIDAGSIANTATVAGTTPKGGTVTSPPSTATVTAQQTNALTLLKSATPQTLTTVGQGVSYTFLVTNTGNTTLTNITISDVFTAPAAPTDTVSCPQTTLAPKQSVTCLLVYTSTQADFDTGSINNTATAHATTPANANVDSNPSSATVVASQRTGLLLVKSATPTTVTAVGQTITYTFAVTNSGTVTVHGLAIADTLAPPAGPALAISCPVATLSPAQSTTCTATYLATQADLDNGVIDNAATASATDPSGAPVTSPQSSATVTVDQAPALTVVKTPSVTTVTDVGDVVTYSFMVTNTGNVTLTHLRVADRFTAPAGPEITPVCPTTTLAPAETTTCTADYTTTRPDFDHGTIVNTATATGTPPSGPPVDSPPSTATVVAQPLPSIGLVKAATVNDLNGNGYPDLNDTILWTFVVTNTGNVTLDSLAVSDAVAGPVSCPVNTLAAGATVTCVATTPHLIIQSDVDAGHVDNTATASGHSAATGDTVTSDPSSTSTPIGARPGLSLVKQGTLHDRGNGRADPGDEILWTFTLTNTGNVTLAGLTVHDPTGGSVTCLVSTLAPGDSTTCVGDTLHVVTIADMNAGSVADTATADGTPPTGPTISCPACSWPRRPRSPTPTATA